MTALRVCAALTLVTTVLFASPAGAAAPTDALRDHIDRIFALLGDPAFRGPDNVAARHRALRALTEEAVDFREAAQRSLGSHWDARTPDERTYFIGLFTDLIDHAYLGRLALDGERLAYDDETTTGKIAIVRARAIAKSGSVTPVIFSLYQGEGAKWRIYDVSFEGMSLVGNYRAQFNKIIRGSSYDELVSRLEAKTRADAQASASTTEAPSQTTRP